MYSSTVKDNIYVKEIKRMEMRVFSVLYRIYNKNAEQLDPLQILSLTSTEKWQVLIRWSLCFLYLIRWQWKNGKGNKPSRWWQFLINAKQLYPLQILSLSTDKRAEQYFISAKNGKYLFSWVSKAFNSIYLFLTVEILLQCHKSLRSDKCWQQEL